jgi:hypothetical protein
MMQNLHAKLNPGLLWQTQQSTRRLFFTNKLDLNLKEETSKVVQLERGFVWC